MAVSASGGRTVSQRGGTIPAPDNRWAMAGANLAEGIQKRIDIQEATRIKKEEEEREFERQLDLIKARSAENLKLGALQNIQNLEVVEPGTPGAIQVAPDLWVAPISKTAFKDNLDLLKFKNKQAQEAQSLAVDQVGLEVESGQIPNTAEAVNQRLRAYTRQNLEGKGITGINLPEQLWGPQETIDFNFLKKGKDHPGEFPVIDKKTGGVKWISDSNVSRSYQNEQGPYIFDDKFVKSWAEPVAKAKPKANRGKEAATVAAAASSFWTVPALKALLAGALPGGAVQSWLAPAATSALPGKAALTAAAFRGGQALASGAAAAAPAVGAAGVGLLGGHLAGTALSRMIPAQYGQYAPQTEALGGGSNLSEATQRMFRDMVTNYQMNKGLWDEAIKSGVNPVEAVQAQPVQEQGYMPVNPLRALRQ